MLAYVVYATTLSDTSEKEKLLKKAVEIDGDSLPRRPLTNLVAQRYARALLSGAAPGRPAAR